MCTSFVEADSVDDTAYNERHKSLSSRGIPYLDGPVV
jgi:3-hydroxyisobutyrate dehydrogenase-like beta-hydroxyacid dehydrogenase